ncbi:hypothetical protein DSM112329_03901 [Paraconexibacter sp. AEG42_29]|uniref:DUF695 domain-containing protein n=1 Tax=Paraconexibacter sp. AEG42_29 TaxID=2997339 RepID=A0AAU7AZG9_9ACTN
MGFLDALLGKRKATKNAPDRLFAITTAAITLETGHDIRPRGSAAVVFQPLATGDFQQIAADVEELVRATGQETGTTVATSEDTFGYRWFELHDPDVEDLAVAINAVNDSLTSGGYSDRLLCAVFAFQDASDAAIYFIYNFKRGGWYPFVPAGGAQQRSNERELQLKAQLTGELPFEPELERWFPLWGTPI